MFERFTQPARDAVIGAQQVARETESRTIDARHLLVALLERPGQARSALAEVGVPPDDLATTVRAQLRAGGLDSDALAALGIDLEAVRRRAEAVFGPSALDRAGRRASRKHLPFTTDAKEVLESALREAIRLHQSRLDDRHLLLGLLRGTGSPAGVQLSRTLDSAGSSIAALRSALEQQRAQAW